MAPARYQLHCLFLGDLSLLLAIDVNLIRTGKIGDDPTYFSPNSAWRSLKLVQRGWHCTRSRRELELLDGIEVYRLTLCVFTVPSENSMTERRLRISQGVSVICKRTHSDRFSIPFS